MRSYKFYHTFNFWDALSKSIGIIGGSINIIMGVVNEASKTVEFSPVIQIVCGASAVIALAMGPWLRDHNTNGILDIFEPVYIQDAIEEKKKDEKEQADLMYLNQKAPPENTNDTSPPS